MSDFQRFTPVLAHKAAFQQRDVRSSLRRAMQQAGPWGWDQGRLPRPEEWKAADERQLSRRRAPA